MLEFVQLGKMENIIHFKAVEVNIILLSQFNFFVFP